MSLTYADGQLVVEVTDTGRPILAAATAVPAGAGRGSVGLRERIALYDGVLDAGPRSGGGWTVRACFPIDAPPLRLDTRARFGGNGLIVLPGGR